MGEKWAFGAFDLKERIGILVLIPDKTQVSVIVCLREKNNYFYYLEHYISLNTAIY